MAEFVIRPEEGQADREFITKLNPRLCEVIDAPAHSKDEVIAFQDRFTASAWDPGAGDSATLIAAGHDGRRLGYVHVREGMDEIANERCGYIALLAVIDEVEGQGVGHSLLKAAEDWARQKGFSRLSLDVFASNSRGQRFYEKSGFRPETVRVIRKL